MKNFFKLSALLISVCATSVALADNSETEVGTKQLSPGYNDIVTTTNAKNHSQTFTIEPISGRDGFVKNEFEITVSANVVLGVHDDDTEGFVGQRFGVVAGANRGRAVFTGTSEGGSVAQCGDLVAKNTANGGASLVVEERLDYANVNGCIPDE